MRRKVVIKVSRAHLYFPLTLSIYFNNYYYAIFFGCEKQQMFVLLKSLFIIPVSYNNIWIPSFSLDGYRNYTQNREKFTRSLPKQTAITNEIIKRENIMFKSVIINDTLW